MDLDIKTKNKFILACESGGFVGFTGVTRARVSEEPDSPLVLAASSLPRARVTPTKPPATQANLFKTHHALIFNNGEI